MKETRGIRRSRATICLLLFLLSASGATRVISDAPELAEKLGALSVPVGLLAAGCWFAYKDGGKAVRIFATVLAVISISSFGFGVIRGYENQQAAREVNAELEQIRSGLLSDSQDDSSASEAARRHQSRTENAARRLQSSKHAETAALGRALESIANLTQASDQRLVDAIDAVGADSFLDVRAMLDVGNFAQQRDTAREYQAAAREACETYGELPAAAEREFAQAGLSDEHLAQVMTGFRKTWPLSLRVFRSHLALADGYLLLIEFVEQHADEIAMNAAGELEFSNDEVGSAYDGVSERVDSAGLQLGESIDALMAAVTKQ